MPFFKRFIKLCTALAIVATLTPNDGAACSLVKVTAGGKTFIGNNEDFSNPETRIWFDPGDGAHFGAVFLGYDNLFPEGGMNEAGLVFDAFSLTDKPLKGTTGKTPIFQLDLKRKIMRECSTVEQVNALLAGYNLYFWSHAAWVFLDASGKYLIVEGDDRIMGDSSYFVQTNFRHSEITDENQITCWRYKKAMSLLKKHREASLGYCTAVMDSVHVDGTLYTTVYDTQNAVVYLYHCHDYSTMMTFDLKKELKKGARVLSIPELFPGNVTSAYKGIRRLKATMDSLAFSSVYLEDSSASARTMNELRKLPYFIHILGNHAYEFLHLKRIPEAMAMLRLFMRMYPETAEAYDFLGEVYLENGQYDLALVQYLRSVEINPLNVNGNQRINQLHAIMEK